MKLSSKTRPRLTIYLLPQEMKAIKREAAAAGLRTPHQWAAQVIRKSMALPVVAQPQE